MHYEACLPLSVQFIQHEGDIYVECIHVSLTQCYGVVHRAVMNKDAVVTYQIRPHAYC